MLTSSLKRAAYIPAKSSCRSRGLSAVIKQPLPPSSTFRAYVKKATATPTPKPSTVTGDVKKKVYATKTFAEGSGSEPRNESLSSQIKQLNAVSNYKQAMILWETAREKGVEVNEFAYATILSTYRHLNDFDGALSLYTEIKSKGIRNSFIDSQIVDVYSRKGETQLAIDLLYDMLSNNIDVKPYAFNSLVKALIANNMVGEAIGMLTQHAKRFQETDKNFWPSIVNTVMATQNDEACHALAKHILETNVALPQASMLAMLHHFANRTEEADVQRFNQLLDWLRNQGSLGMSTLIVFHTERNDSAGALEVWKELKEMPKFFSAIAFTHLITVCAASGHLTEVEELYHAMIASGYEPSSAVLAAMIRLYASNLRVEDARNRFEALLAQPYYISPFLFNTMLDMYADIGDTASALEIVNKMREKRMKFNVSIYNSLINLHLRTDQPEKAIEVYNQMKQEKINMNFQTYRPLLAATNLPANSSFDRAQMLKEIKASKTISELAKSILKQTKPTSL